MFLWSEGWDRFLTLLITGFTLFSTTPVVLAVVQEHAKGCPSAANGLSMMKSFVARSAIVVIVWFMDDIIGLRNNYVINSILA